MRGYRHIIWDWNGTLLDDMALCVEVLNQTLRDHGLAAIDARRYRDEFGFPVRDFYHRLGLSFDREPYEDFAVRWLAIYDRRRDTCALQADVPLVLERLRQAGLAQSVLSAYPQTGLDQMIARHGLAGYFAQVLGRPNALADGKLAQGRELVARLDLDPREVLVVGDTTHDHEVARGLGSDALLLSCGHQSRGRLLSTGAPVCARPGEVLDWALRAA